MQQSEPGHDLDGFFSSRIVSSKGQLQALTVRQSRGKSRTGRHHAHHQSARNTAIKLGLSSSEMNSDVSETCKSTDEYSDELVLVPTNGSQPVDSNGDHHGEADQAKSKGTEMTKIIPPPPQARGVVRHVSTDTLDQKPIGRGDKKAPHTPAVRHVRRCASTGSNVEGGCPTTLMKFTRPSHKSHTRDKTVPRRETNHSKEEASENSQTELKDHSSGGSDIDFHGDWHHVSDSNMFESPKTRAKFIRKANFVPPLQLMADEKASHAVEHRGASQRMGRAEIHVSPTVLHNKLRRCKRPTVLAPRSLFLFPGSRNVSSKQIPHTVVLNPNDQDDVSMMGSVTESIR